MPSPRTVSCGLALLVVVAALVLGLAPKPWDPVEKPGRVDHIAAVGSWWAGLINLVPLVLLAATTRWWMRRRPADAAERAPAPLPRGFVPAVAAAMGVFAILGAFRMNDSLWHDEEFAVRHAILGTYRIDKDDNVKLKKLDWSRTLWSYTKATNHVLQSVLSRLSLSTWRMVARPEGLQVNEIAVRLPSYLAGVLSIGALALLLARAGLPGSGVLAAWLFALHPWLLKLAPEARGYPIVILLAIIACLCAIRALDSNRWAWWWALAAAEFALLHTWPLSAFVVAVLNVVLGFSIFARSGSDRAVVTGRWLATGLVAAMLFLQLFLPCWIQFRQLLQENHELEFYSSWPKNILSLFFVGGYWVKSAIHPLQYLEFHPLAATHPLATSIAIGLILAFLIIGAFRLAMTPPHGRLLAAVFIFPGILMAAVAVGLKEYLFEWYFSFMLPGFIALVAIGVVGFGLRWARLTRIPAVTGALAAVLLAGFVWLTWEMRVIMLSRPAQAFRESVLLTRPGLDPNAPENRAAITAGTLMLPSVYDPRVRKAETKDDYLALMKEADRRGVPLFVNNGFPKILADTHRDIDAMLKDPALFEQVAYLDGYEPDLDRAVYKYRPGSVGDAPVSGHVPATGDETTE